MACSSNCFCLVDCFAGVIAGRLIIYKNQQTAGNKKLALCGQPFDDFYKSKLTEPLLIKKEELPAVEFDYC